MPLTETDRWCWRCGTRSNESPDGFCPRCWKSSSKGPVALCSLPDALSTARKNKVSRFVARSLRRATQLSGIGMPQPWKGYPLVFCSVCGKGVQWYGAGTQRECRCAAAQFIVQDETLNAPEKPTRPSVTEKTQWIYDEMAVQNDTRSSWAWPGDDLLALRMRLLDLRRVVERIAERVAYTAPQREVDAAAALAGQLEGLLRAYAQQRDGVAPPRESAVGDVVRRPRRIKVED